MRFSRIRTERLGFNYLERDFSCIGNWRLPVTSSRRKSELWRWCLFVYAAADEGNESVLRKLSSLSLRGLALFENGANEPTLLSQPLRCKEPEFCCKKQQQLLFFYNTRRYKIFYKSATSL